MGFIIAKLAATEDGSVRIERVRRFALVGHKGFLARNAHLLATRHDGTWNLTREAVLRIAEPEAGPVATLLFDLTPESDKLNFYELVDITGHTSSDSTDAILHFKIVCSRLPKRGALREDGTLTVPPWRGIGLDHFEQIRLTGGTSGGPWSVTEPAQALSAVVLSKR
ncbi:MAG: hypothetical protein WAJ85_12220 [Candidatus Baltobacteraceae bacterium]|jgi:hypothetical protein